jgi:uncharacterized protein YndB with AHSA1/START domain
VTNDPSDDTLVVRRVIAVPRERVFAAWLDPASLAKFMLPGDVTVATAEVDAKVGGKFRIVMTHKLAVAEHWGWYLAIEPPSLLSFSWISENTDFKPTVVTIELRDHERGTELTLTHRGLPKRTRDAHREGWSDIVRAEDELLRAK